MNVNPFDDRLGDKILSGLFQALTCELDRLCFKLFNEGLASVFGGELGHYLYLNLARKLVKLLLHRLLDL